MAVDKNKIIKGLRISAVILGTAFVGLEIAAKKKKPDSVYANQPEEKNHMEGKQVRFVKDEIDPENADGVRGHLVSKGKETHTAGIYEKYVKRGLDVFFSFGGLVVLSPVLGAITLAIKIDDPGPAIFVQKRVGQNKQYFKLHKFRSMKMSTPHDVPTHMLDNPDQYITKVGRFIRAHSLDELPQIWDIFLGNMSVIGPRPALWNQDLLTAERDKYGANDVKPGLTGWAQINGRDELEIPDKARLDGEYVSKLNSSALDGLKMDAKCFAGSLHVFNGDDTVVEGGTGKMNHENVSFSQSLPDEPTSPSISKHILITGANSYIGDSVKTYLEKTDSIFYKVTVKDTIDWEPKPSEFSGYDIVFNVAGIAHIKETDENRNLYYKVNRDLVVKIAKAAKEAGVRHFILLSSMSVYGLTTGYITKETVPKPNNAYGKSKLQADKEIEKLKSQDFKVAFLRPPMVYGKGCKGNYRALRSFALKFPIFPDYKNARSMIYIGNLCEFVKRIIDKEAEGIFFPQNAVYVNTSEMVREIAGFHNRKKVMLKIFNLGIKTVPINIIKKVFGDLTYEKVDLVSKYNFQESIEMTEGHN